MAFAENRENRQPLDRERDRNGHGDGIKKFHKFWGIAKWIREASGAGALAGFFELAQFDAANFAADRFGQIVDELDLTRIFVRRGYALAVLTQFVGERITAGD